MTQNNHTSPTSHLSSIPNGLDRLSRIFVVVKLKMLTITCLALADIRKLNAEMVIGPKVRLYPEFIDREINSGLSVGCLSSQNLYRSLFMKSGRLLGSLNNAVPGNSMAASRKTSKS